VGSPTLVERYRRARRDPGLAVLEGFHPLKHALRFGAVVEEVAVVDPERPRALARMLAPDILPSLEALPLTVTPPEIFEQLAPVPPRERMIALARRPAPSLDAALASPDPAPLVLLENPTHHPNIGAAVRVAAAAGAAGLLVVGELDPWHPAALRGGVGLQFALPVARADRLPPTDRPLIAVAPGGEPLRRELLPPRAILAFGSERRGLSPDLLAAARLRVGIPMRPGVSSLSLATAVAVVLYAWRGVV
jgi:TrmH family RNA methyltransferase